MASWTLNIRTGWDELQDLFPAKPLWDSVKYHTRDVRSFTSLQNLSCIEIHKLLSRLHKYTSQYYTDLLHGCQEQSGEKKTGISEGQTVKLREGTSLVPWHISRQHLPSRAMGHFGDLEKIPALQLGAVLGHPKPIWAQCCVCSPLWGWVRREQKFSAACLELRAWSWGSFWAIRLTHKCWIIFVWLISLQNHPWASPGSLSLPRRLSRGGTRSCQLAVWKIAAAMQLNVCLHFKSNFASSSNTALRFAPNKIPSNWVKSLLLFQHLSTKCSLEQECNGGTNKIRLSETPVPLSIIFN